ncbi:cryptochrome/photolyase family protein [Streptacidiphilus jiangxiensis]|uniref:Deoxyribodipyrimidine photo-lyase n=1 Tax=Streptacidiphilus jiangxiensis TaxID=235985 RepID=A0A1H7N5B2_STRJI|nr:deoxyribodipyrimidine photo-lyase [Streptacidiphilus jiangxiensis]SEL18683.1 deoxyribodipyrimidine photo-lyase [Streptacidiphilus jiangxiensis]
MTVRICLFTRDLRLADNPVLFAASAGGREAVVPVFVSDPAVAAAGFAAPNRLAFLHDCLANLDGALRERGSRLVLRRGSAAEEVARLVHDTGASEVHLAADHSAFARAREERLRAAVGGAGARLVTQEAVVTAVAPGAVTPTGSDHYAVFTPYLRRWSQVPQRRPLPPPRGLLTPAALASAPLPHRPPVDRLSPQLAKGGESEARARMRRWLDGHLDDYEDEHDTLANDLTSRFSPDLHFGSLSATELVHRARTAASPGARAFERQLAWRDFHHQVLAARPDAAHADYRSRHDRWRDDPAELEAWRQGRTGYPLVDAGMRQLSAEGWMHNRARMVTASFLCKTLGLDWREGARHFLSLLVDGDVANNQLNWQWVAGTGTDTRPNRVLNPVAQAKRYDPDGAYVRRWVPELARLSAPAIFEPWRLPSALRAELGYPAPLVALDAALARFRARRGVAA